MEAAGVVIENNSPEFRPGERVAYACPPSGAYVTMRTMAADQLVLLPDTIGDETAAAVPAGKSARRARMAATWRLFLETTCSSRR